jgi:hypothetical protein
MKARHRQRASATVRIVSERSRSLRWLSSLFVAAIALHQLRYLIGPGADPGHSLAAGAHAYLPFATTFVALLFGASLVHFASTLALARRGAIRPPLQTRFGRGCLAATVALIAIFTVQESLEGALLGGHSSGLHGLFGHGGWMALVLAPVLGAAVALFIRGTQSVIAAVARTARGGVKRERPSPWPQLPDPGFTRTDVLASHLASRPPPAFAS